MIKMISCTNCHISSSPLESVTVNLTLQKSKFCDHCRHHDEQKHNLFFCSPKCMLTWLKEHEEDFLKEVAAKLGRSSLKDPEAFFTDPKSSTMNEEAKRKAEEESDGEVLLNNSD